MTTEIKETDKVAAIEELRAQLDEIDGQIVKLYEQRMSVCAQVGEYKIENGRKVLDQIGRAHV